MSRLGSGVDELLGGAVEKVEPKGLTEVAIEKLKPGKYQPRRDFDPEALADLAASIKAQGIIQPIVIRPAGDSYEIIAGERRWRAAQLAELRTVPVVIKHVNDEQTMAMSLIENIQRQDLNVIEEAVALQRLISEFDMTHQEIAEKVGRSRAAVSNTLRLLNLSQYVQKMVQNGELDAGHARALLVLDSNAQAEAAEAMVKKGMSVREAERYVKKALKGDSKPSKKLKQDDPNIRRLCDDISEKLGAHVTIDHRGGGKGKLVVSYNSLDELDGILSHIH